MPSIRQRRLMATYFFALALIFAGARIGLQYADDNFHEVVAGELYRSAQPSAADIAHYSKTYGIRTIINLRDEERGPWYTEEKHAAATHGITLIDYPISSAQQLPAQKTDELARLMSTAEQPILIHCEHGANRTGLASAVYMHHTLGRPDWLATLQLSPYYGHLPIPGLGRHEMFQSWLAYDNQYGS